MLISLCAFYVLDIKVRLVLISVLRRYLGGVVLVGGIYRRDLFCVIGLLAFVLFARVVAFDLLFRAISRVKHTSREI